MIVLSFDISSSCIGYSLSESGEIVRYGFVDISHIDSFFLFDKVRIFRELFPFPERIDRIVVEEHLKVFHGSMSSIDTILLLAKINSLISFVMYEKYNVYPQWLNVTSVRKSIGLKIDKTSNVPKKQQIMDFINENKTKMFLLKTKKDKIDKRNWDVADSIAVNLGFLYKTNQSKNKSIKK